jgi:tRNA(Phe) wybutosine-synthesizing methylase Tyw3
VLNRKVQRNKEVVKRLEEQLQAATKQVLEQKNKIRELVNILTAR